MAVNVLDIIYTCKGSFQMYACDWLLLNRPSSEPRCSHFVPPDSGPPPVFQELRSERERLEPRTHGGGGVLCLDGLWTGGVDGGNEGQQRNNKFRAERETLLSLNKPKLKTAKREGESEGMKCKCRGREMMKREQGMKPLEC